ncbi:MAG: hypothetical protein OXU20_07230 [Myxococcales bacterium]|nr:hypothetical protein [Myxococcales bacterium]MDD9970639.1 hypothetical protein [Myxococcales bacterium]
MPEKAQLPTAASTDRPMHIRFIAPTLAELDRLRCDAIVLTLFSDERPLRGAGGLVDWRLCGAISQRLMDGFITGDRDEQVLVPAQKRLPVEKVFLFGLGPQAALSVDHASERLGHILRTVTQAGGCTSAVVLPGRSTEVVAPVAAMEALVRASQQGPPMDEIVLIERHDSQRQMAPVVDRERRRAQADGF